MSKLLSIKDLCVDFQTPTGLVRAVDHASFDVLAGQTVGLVGESGSGKSVTSFAIMQLIPTPPGKISKGEVLFQGEDLLKYSAAQMRAVRGNDISMIFQEPMTSLNPVFKVGEQVAEVLRLHRGLSKKQARAQAIDLMDQVGIPNPSKRVDAYPHELSGGQKQRIMIAISIACEPKLLIADEPTTALDVTIQKQVIELMLKLQERYGMGILFITHDLGVIGDIADEVVVMYQSKLVEKGSCRQIFQSPSHPYSRGLLACRPGLESNPRRLLTVSDFMDQHSHEIQVDPRKLAAHTKDYSFSEVKNPYILEVNDLITSFPIKGGVFGKTKDEFIAVNNVSFKIRKGKTFGLVGESGCGKTTLGRSLIRLIEPKSGTIKFQGQELIGLSNQEMMPVRSKMQIIFQDPFAALNPRMNVGDIICEPILIHGNNNKKLRLDRAKFLLEKVGLSANFISRYPHQFSGGQRQRICIARALSLQPEFIICDESVSALDVSVQAQVLNLLLDLQDEFNLTYVFISHDLSVVNFISDTVAVMYAGQIVEMDKAEIIYRNPRKDYTKQLLAAIPRGISPVRS